MAHLQVDMVLPLVDMEHQVLDTTAQAQAMTVQALDMILQEPDLVSTPARITLPLILVTPLAEENERLKLKIISPRRSLRCLMIWASSLLTLHNL